MIGSYFLYFMTIIFWAFSLWANPDHKTILGLRNCEGALGGLMGHQADTWPESLPRALRAIEESVLPIRLIIVPEDPTSLARDQHLFKYLYNHQPHLRTHRGQSWSFHSLESSEHPSVSQSAYLYFTEAPYYRSSHWEMMWQPPSPEDPLLQVIYLRPIRSLQESASSLAALLLKLDMNSQEVLLLNWHPLGALSSIRYQAPHKGVSEAGPEPLLAQVLLGVFNERARILYAQWPEANEEILSVYQKSLLFARLQIKTQNLKMMQDFIQHWLKP